MLKLLLDIFMAFFRASILSYGGGPASIPLMQNEIVKTYHWYTNEQFADLLAMGNTLPGPIAPKIAASVGYQVAGYPGAAVGVIATVVPTAIIIILLAKLLLTYKDAPRVQGLLRVAKPIVVVLLLQAAIELMAKKNYPNLAAFVISITAFVAVVFLKIHPGLVMITGLFLGFTFYKFF